MWYTVVKTVNCYTRDFVVVVYFDVYLLHRGAAARWRVLTLPQLAALQRFRLTI